jgi:hypothetical protein
MPSEETHWPSFPSVEFRKIPSPAFRVKHPHTVWPNRVRHAWCRRRVALFPPQHCCPPSRPSPAPGGRGLEVAIPPPVSPSRGRESGSALAASVGFGVNRGARGAGRPCGWLQAREVADEDQQMRLALPFGGDPKRSRCSMNQIIIARRKWQPAMGAESGVATGEALDSSAEPARIAPCQLGKPCKRCLRPGNIPPLPSVDSSRNTWYHQQAITRGL